MHISNPNLTFKGTAISPILLRMGIFYNPCFPELTIDKLIFNVNNG